MVEDDETATARYVASNISTQLMLKTIIEIIATMADDPDKYRARLKAKLFEAADTMPLAEMTPGARGQGSRVRSRNHQCGADQLAAELGRKARDGGS